MNRPTAQRPMGGGGKMKELNLHCATPADTQTVGESLGRLLRGGDLVALEGELGSGKTTFCQGVGRGLGLREALTSPTYLLCNEYLADAGPVLHMDAYFRARLDSLLGEGFIERLSEGPVVLLEWADQVAEWLPAERLTLRLAPQPGGGRSLSFLADGIRAQELLGLLAGSLLDSGISVEPTGI